MSSSERTIQDFYGAAIKNEFARDFQFMIQTLGPLTEDDLIYFTTATLPKKSIACIPVPYMGLQFNIPGSVKYEGSDSWTVKFRLDEGSNIRNLLLGWQTEIFSVASSKGKYGTPVEIATICQLGKDRLPLRTYNLHGIFIKEVGEVSYDIQGEGAIMEFDAVFAYQFWTEVGGPEQV